MSRRTAERAYQRACAVTMTRGDNNDHDYGPGRMGRHDELLGRPFNNE